jgi:dienelactone hydrolase
MTTDPTAPDQWSYLAEPEAEGFTDPGTVHSFANAGIPAKFAPEAAGMAWTRTVAFLQRHLLA